jgi:hypothetical protein
LLSLVGQFVTGKTLPALGLPNLIAVDLAMAMLLPCFIVVSRLKRPGLRIFGGVPTIGAIMLTSFLHSHGGELLFTPPGILLWLLAAALSQGVLWWRLHRHYASVDLIFGTGIQIASPFGEMTINRT